MRQRSLYATLRCVVHPAELDMAELLALELCLRDGGATLLDDANEADGNAVTHIVCHPKAYQTFSAQRNERFVALVRPEWVFRTFLLQKLLPVDRFTPNPAMFFSTLAISAGPIAKDPRKVINGLITHFGGQIVDQKEVYGGATHVLSPDEASENSGGLEKQEFQELLQLSFTKGDIARSVEAWRVHLSEQPNGSTFTLPSCLGAYMGQRAGLSTQYHVKYDWIEECKLVAMKETMDEPIVLLAQHIAPLLRETVSDVLKSVDAKVANVPFGESYQDIVGKVVTNAAFVVCRYRGGFEYDEAVRQVDIRVPIEMGARCRKYLPAEVYSPMVSSLGGRVSQIGRKFDTKCTHIICFELKRTEKFIAGCAAGKWILKPSYLEACSVAGKFVEEAAYEWGTDASDKELMDPRIWPEAPAYWRKELAAGKLGAFAGWRFFIHSKCVPPRDMCERIAVAGGGSVVPLIKSTDVAALSKESTADEPVVALLPPDLPARDTWLKKFKTHNIECIKANFIIDYVTKEQRPPVQRADYQI
ncbi:hypothetical protein BBO99_00007109 [Phytophthora kernoviae]|uniref:BRCT domain-containing protein n=2 Tax=Phytophthora kernoviae TaxID=325452 RepID=A0A3R7GVY4_9STRA|nr:hypothetical protein G195_007621 [Phytophthora kernoviae 00238/432]KAG2520726.1 hypothetical protein JM16_005868 [Phytophthora kernoviae]KAG2521845.1 hypothetical protein JM18_006416 [Phytophthora kernoviae]RLN37783.1 hypothetical protein BBI17_007066 [Phytophthora kernoviae]RLN76987.1 hypothetical protein BBO99_00007109 [Phytophthora kernoviae]